MLMAGHPLENNFSLSFQTWLVFNGMFKIFLHFFVEKKIKERKKVFNTLSKFEIHLTRQISELKLFFTKSVLQKLWQLHFHVHKGYKAKRYKLHNFD
jgi:hypothetical protein